MAATCARKSAQFASASARFHLSRRPSSAFSSDTSKVSSFGSCTPSSASRVSAQKRSLSFSWLPKQLAGAQVLQHLYNTPLYDILLAWVVCHPDTIKGCILLSTLGSTEHRIQ